MFYSKDKNMYFFTDEEKQEAHNISTIDYLQKNYGFSFKKAGKAFKCEEHDSLIIQADEKAWYWNSRGFGGGDVISFVQKTENLSYADALRAILNPTVTNNQKQTYTKATKNNVTKDRNIILPPKTEGKYNRVFAYLVKTRKIDPKIVATLMRKKFLYEDSKHNCVFVGYNAQGLPAYATLRTTNTNVKFRGEAVGSDKSNGFFLKGYNKDTVYVFEAPIDLLSHASMCNIKAGDDRQWLDSSRIALGCIADNALANYLNNNSEVKNIVFCLDNDEAGIKATEKYMLKYADLGYNVSSQPPTLKDYNEDLTNLVTKKVNAVTI